MSIFPSNNNYFFLFGKTKRRWKNWIKTVFLFFIYIFLFLGIFFGGLQVFQMAKNFLAEQKDRKIENTALLQEVQKINENLFISCQNENKTRRYLLLAEHDCQTFLGEKINSSEQESTLSQDFLSFFHLFFVEQESFPEVVEKFLTENTLENKTPENSLFHHNEEEFESIKNTPEIFSYIQSFGYILQIKNPKKSEEKEISENSLFLSTKENPETILAEIFWDTEKQEMQVKYSLEKNKKEILISLQNFSNKREEIEKEFSQENQKNIISELENINITDSQDKRENILLIGHNEGNTDTIILISFNHIRKTITMISLPRDLWRENRKINSFRLKFGHSAFVQKIEEISGQKISSSLGVDMDIFPKLIDQIGGIYFTFTNPLIDPTYKTQENGKEGTLFYEKGTHHLSGIEALRVARSRHTTSDFSRAKRQQDIIKAIREKISQKNFLDLLPLVKILFKNIETDITPLSAVKLYWQTKDYEVKNGVVLSTSNILESEMIDVGRGVKAYALLPKNNDWDIIKKFIWKELLR